MAQANMDIRLLQDTQFTYGVYTCRLSGYSVVSMVVPIRHYGRVAVFYCVMPQFYVKALQHFVPNIVRLQIVNGDRQWYIVGCHTYPNDASTIECVLAAVGKRPRWSKLLVAGNFKANITVPD